MISKSLGLVCVSQTIRGTVKMKKTLYTKYSIFPSSYKWLEKDYSSKCSLQGSQIFTLIYYSQKRCTHSVTWNPFSNSPPISVTTITYNSCAWNDFIIIIIIIHQRKLILGTYPKIIHKLYTQCTHNILAVLTALQSYDIWLPFEIHNDVA